MSTTLNPYSATTQFGGVTESNSSGNDADADIGPSYDSDTMSENNSNIISDIPNMDPDRDKEEHDYVDYEKQRALFASLINNLKFDVEKCTKDNREAQQANVLLTKEIKLLNEEISNLKTQACQNDKTFSRENGKFDESVQPLFKRKNELEKKNQELLKQVNVLDNKLRKGRQIDQTL
ncbi:hypothetical protein Tco_0351415 [Tanacetum coccineum]